MSTDTKVVRDNLRSLLREYQRVRPNLSLRSIARNAGVNRYFLTKILEDAESKKVDLDQLLLLWKFMKSVVPVNKFIDGHVEAIESYLSQHILGVGSEQSFLGPSSDQIVLDLNDQEVDLHDRNNYLIFLLACCDNGFTKSEILSILGCGARKNLDYLIEKEKIVVDKNNKIKLPGDKHLIFTNSLMNYHFIDLTRFYQVSHRGQRRNNINQYIQGLTKEGIEKVFDLTKEYEYNMLEIFTNKKYIGENPFFYVSCFDTLTDELR